MDNPDLSSLAISEELIEADNQISTVFQLDISPEEKINPPTITSLEWDAYRDLLDLFGTAMYVSYLESEQKCVHGLIDSITSNMNSIKAELQKTPHLAYILNQISVGIDNLDGLKNDYDKSIAHNNDVFNGELVKIAKDNKEETFKEAIEIYDKYRNMAKKKLGVKSVKEIKGIPDKIDFDKNEFNGTFTGGLEGEKFDDFNGFFKKLKEYAAIYTIYNPKKDETDYPNLQFEIEKGYLKGTYSLSLSEECKTLKESAERYPISLKVESYNIHGKEILKKNLLNLENKFSEKYILNSE